MDSTTTTCECLARLFQYPEHHNRLMDDTHTAQGLLKSDESCSLNKFRMFVEETTLGRLQESYVAAFDVAPATFPYLGYQLHGDTYNRTAYMMQLLGVYKGHHFVFDRKEMPDHLGVILQFMAFLEGPDMEGQRRAFLHQFVLDAVSRMVEKTPLENVRGWSLLIHVVAEWVREQIMEAEQ